MKKILLAFLSLISSFFFLNYRNTAKAACQKCYWTYNIFDIDSSSGGCYRRYICNVKSQVDICEKGHITPWGCVCAPWNCYRGSAND